MRDIFTAALSFVALTATAVATPQPQAQPSGTIPELSPWTATPPSARPTDAAILHRLLSRADADWALMLLAVDRMRQLIAAERGAVAALAIKLGDKTLRWESRKFGDAPFGRRSLWISMHGGGNAAPAVNDQQWRNQIRLYEPAEGIYLAPRAPPIRGICGMRRISIRCFSG